LHSMLKGPVTYWFWNPTLPWVRSGETGLARQPVAALSLAYQEQLSLSGQSPGGFPAGFSKSFYPGTTNIASIQEREPGRTTEGRLSDWYMRATTCIYKRDKHLQAHRNIPGQPAIKSRGSDQHRECCSLTYRMRIWRG
jgi:hypothetical protein